MGYNIKTYLQIGVGVQGVEPLARKYKLRVYCIKTMERSTTDQGLYGNNTSRGSTEERPLLRGLGGFMVICVGNIEN